MRRRELVRPRPRLAPVVGEGHHDRLGEEREHAAAELRPRHVDAAEERRARVLVSPDILLVVEQEAVAVRRDHRVRPAGSVDVGGRDREELGRLLARLGARSELGQARVVGTRAVDECVSCAGACEAPARVRPRAVGDDRFVRVFS